jgi:S1-C subfamily serine protease
LRFPFEELGYDGISRFAREVAVSTTAIPLAISAALLGSALASEATLHLASDRAVSASICPVVYALDQSSAERGYRYIFYGNAFFVDRQGYLLTAAHVLTDFHDGGQPQILLRLPEAPPRLVKVELVATDAQHDIAILRAVPNPFEGRYSVAFLPLASAKPAEGSAVLAAALRPSRLRDPRTFDAPQEDQSPAEVLEYTSLRLDKGQPEAELFLFSHEVIRGQSGAPILSGDSQQVVGIVEGQWLHPTPLSAAARMGNALATVGAGVPITYALRLLEQNHVAWQSATQAKNQKTE